jgi:hypothetical protein
MVTAIQLRNPATGKEVVAYEGYSWTSLFFGAFPALLRGDILIGIGVFCVIVVMGLAAFAVGLQTWVGSGIVGLVWGFFYNDIHRSRKLREGYEVVGKVSGENANAGLS